MVKGLEVFRDHFREYTDHFVLIGGTACDLVMQEAGLPFRATRDLDVVLCIETLDSSFVKAFWGFIKAGRYQIHQKSSGEKQFYRFLKPDDGTFPYMLELFSRIPDALGIVETSHLTPIKTEDYLSSLSAILLNDDYYTFILSGKRDLEGVPAIGVDRLIPLKAKAWLDLTGRKNRGETIDSKTIKKHKNDIFRLYQILDPEPIVDIPGTVAMDIGNFITRISTESIDLKAIGLRTSDQGSILEELKRIYGIK